MVKFVYFRASVSLSGGRIDAKQSAIRTAKANERAYIAEMPPTKYGGIVSSINLGVAIASIPTLSPYNNLPPIIAQKFGIIVILTPTIPTKAYTISIRLRPYLISFPPTAAPITHVSVAEDPTID